MAKACSIGLWAYLLVLGVGSTEITGITAHYFRPFALQTSEIRGEEHELIVITVWQEEQYYQMPQLFHLDNYEECMASRDGVFCVGNFELSADEPNPVMDIIREVSSGYKKFNHTLLYRGYCTSSRCTHIQDTDIAIRFENCVNDHISKQYGIQAKLYKLDYCKASVDPPKPIDAAEMLFAGITLLIVLLNVVGTTYDIKRNLDDKPNPYLMAWSLRKNWNRLIATNEDGNSKLDTLKPVYGIRGLLVPFVIFIHSGIVQYTGYIQNPRYLENIASNPLSMIFQNCYMAHQIFFVLSSFLFTYNVLLYTETAKEKPSFRMLPFLLLYRISRVQPVHLWMVGLMATWWVRIGDGALWGLVIQQEADRCRQKWWTHSLFIHNLYNPQEPCLIQSWCLGVDMQLFVPTALLTFALLSRPHVAFRVISALVVAITAINFHFIDSWDLKPMVQISSPESARVLGRGADSFMWSYAAPMSNVSSSLMGVGVAFLFYEQQKAKVKPKSAVFMLLYKLYVPLILSWILAGQWTQLITYKPAWVLYEVFERPTVSFLTALTMLGIFHNIDSPLLRLLSWSGWRYLGRMSLSCLMVHWNFNLSLISMVPVPIHVSILIILGHILVVMLLTFLTALPVHLCIETPAHKFMQALMA